MADARGLPSGIVAFAALDDPGVETLLASHAEHAGVRGIRHIVNWHPDPARSYAAADATTSDAWAQGLARNRKSVVSGTSVSVRVALGALRTNIKKKTIDN